jgi:leader peptidase (prepilin peptidase)/N-methyltransferase
MLAWYWGIVVFCVGAGVGSFINVVVSRLPLEKSLLWPGSRCGVCYQRIRWFDNLPLISFLVLRGRCRTCGAGFSVRYFVIELVTALGFVGLYVAELVCNIHGWPLLSRGWAIAEGIFPWQWWAGYAHHAVLFAFLVAASACDLAGREIPLKLTLTGTLIGLAGATLMPWPWPNTTGVPAPDAGAVLWMMPPPLGPGISPGTYPWPVWGPLPGWLAPGGNWQTGLATGIVGLLIGSFLLRTVGFVFSKGLGKEALGLGDADLMMMAGAFLGWQVVVAGFFLSVIPGLIIGLVNMISVRDNSLAFGPALALGVVAAMLGWRWLGLYLQPLMFQAWLLLAFLGAACVFLLISSLLLRAMRSDKPGPDGGDSAENVVQTSAREPTEQTGS